MSKPKVGDVLRCEEGSAVVVEDGTSPVDALLTLLEEGYGGDRFSRTNLAVLAAAAEVKISNWSFFTKEQRDEYGYDDNWWGPDGHGKQFITVAYYDGEVYALGDDARAVEDGTT